MTPADVPDLEAAIGWVRSRTGQAAVILTPLPGARAWRVDGGEPR